MKDFNLTEYKKREKTWLKESGICSRCGRLVTNAKWFGSSHFGGTCKPPSLRAPGSAFARQTERPVTIDYERIRNAPMRQLWMNDIGAPIKRSAETVDPNQLKLGI